jgi:hypothetical protein
MTAQTSIDFNQLNGLLWRYRPYLDRFEFLLEVQLMVSASGRQSWQRHMADLFEETAAVLNALDLEREVLLGDSASLSDIIADAPEPWDEILSEQQVAFETTTARINGLRLRNNQAIAEGTAGVDQLINALVEASGLNRGDSGPSYGQDGQIEQDGVSAMLFDGRA